MARTRTTPAKRAPKSKTPRRRLTAEHARAAILDAAEKRLRDAGPEGLRLQEIARDVGISHPTVLHHFGSREGLVAALVARTMQDLEAELVGCFAAARGPDDLTATIARVDEVMRVHGQARLLAWLALMGETDAPRAESRLREIAHLVHAAREAMSGKKHAFEDTAFGLLLASVATFGAALLGPGLLRMMGMPDDEEALVKFRTWVADLLASHAGLDHQGDAR